MTFCLQFGDVKTGGHRERERGGRREGGREREMPRWIDRQMQKRAELGITDQRFFPRLFCHLVMMTVVAGAGQE